MAPKKVQEQSQKNVKKGDQGHSKKDDHPKPSKDDKKDVEESQKSGPASNTKKVDPTKAPAQDPSGPKRTDTTSSVYSDGPGSLMRAESGLSGFFSAKSTTSTGLSEGKVKLADAIKGDDGQVSPTKLLRMILEKTTVIPAVGGKGVQAGPGNEQELSPASAVEGESGSRPGSSGGVSLAGTGGVPVLDEIPIIINWNHRPAQKAEHWIKPYDREGNAPLVDWNGGPSLPFAALQNPEAREERKQFLDTCIQEGTAVPFTMFLNFSEPMTAYDGQIGKDVKESIDGIFRAYGRHFDLQINLHFNFPQIQYDPEGAAEAARITANLTKIIVMISQDEFAERMQKKTDAMIAQALANEDTKAQKRGSKARDQRGRHGKSREQSQGAESDGNDKRLDEHEERLFAHNRQEYSPSRYDRESQSKPSSSGLRKHR